MKTAIAFTLALAASTASAEGAWTKFNDNSGIFAFSADQTAMLVIACGGTMSFIRANPAASLDFRIDGNQHYTLKAAPTRIPANNGLPETFTHVTYMTGDLLWELMDGMKLMVNWSDADFDRFSLIGFTETMKTLDCIPVNETRL